MFNIGVGGYNPLGLIRHPKERAYLVFHRKNYYWLSLGPDRKYYQYDIAADFAMTENQVNNIKAVFTLHSGNVYFLFNNDTYLVYSYFPDKSDNSNKPRLISSYPRSFDEFATDLDILERGTQK